MNRKRITLILLVLLLLASLLACTLFGVKAVQRIRLRREAMAAYENKDYELAERLLREYVQEDPDAEAAFVTLANIYHEFGNAEMEAQMWQMASSLNPQNPEYFEKMLSIAVKSASYPLLHGILGRKANVDEAFTDQELYLYVISSFRSGYPKDAEEAYAKAVDADPEVFHKSELGKMAEFLVVYDSLSESDRDTYLNRAMQSDDPVIRFEALFFTVRRLDQDEAEEAEFERVLKQLVETNRFAGTPLLADFYFSKYRFDDVVNVSGPYLETVDNVDLYLLYAESCVFTGRLNELKTLKTKLRKKSGTLRFLADYCDSLIAYLENDEVKLVAAVRKTGKLINSSLSRFILLRVAVASDTFGEVRTVAEEIFSSKPFYDLHIRSLLLCLDCIVKEMQKPDKRKDMSQITDLARILSGYLHGNRMLTDIILMDQYQKGLVKESGLMAALEMFPDDALLLRIAADYLIRNGKAERAISVLKPALAATKEMDPESARGVLFLYMLALDSTEQRDEAAAVFRELVERSEYDPDMLNRYFQYCVKNTREEDLTSMADTLDTVQDGKLDSYGKFFRAAALLAKDDRSVEKEALDMLASTPVVDPDFTFYAANRLCEHDRLDEAEERYDAIRETYRIPSLILVNLSIVYHAKGEEKKAMDAVKAAFNMDKTSMLPAFIYAKRLSEAERWQEAVDVLKFPRYTVNYRKDIVELWIDCMRHVIEQSIEDRRFLRAEEQCKHLLMNAPDDEYGKETLEKVRNLLFPEQ